MSLISNCNRCNSVRFWAMLAVILAMYFTTLLAPRASYAQFVTRSGNKFMLSGSEYRKLGFTSYYLCVGNWKSQHPDSEVDAVFQSAAANHMTLFRATDIIYDFNISDMNLQFSETVWTRIDYILDSAKRHGIKVILDISNIPQTLNYFSTPLDFTAPANYSQYDRLYSFVPNRVNTINGTVYKNDPTIVSYAIAGEPVPYGINKNGSGQYTSYDPNNYESMYAHAASLLKQNDPNHLVCAGGFIHMDVKDSNGNWFYKQVWSQSQIDYAAMHVYPQNPIPYPSGDWINLPAYKAYADSINKPMMLEEWGLNLGTYTNASDQQKYFNSAFNETYGNNIPIMVLWSWHMNPTGFDVWPGVSSSMDQLVNIVNTNGNRWATAPSGGSQGPVPAGTYKIVNLYSGKALEVASSGTANGSNVDQRAYNGGNNQQWTLTPLGNNQYEIVGVGSGKALEVFNNSTALGANVDIWSYDGQNAKKWKLNVLPDSPGYYTLTNVNSSLALDVYGASQADGANVDQYTSSGSAWQQWTFLAP